MKRITVFLVSAMAACGAACLWDSDTLAMEAKGLPDVVRVISGRFERNPPLYYEMRLKRVAAAIKTDPGNLDLYDDAGVACARLGRNDEAVAWMAKKLVVLETSKAGGKANTEQWYRYHANLGTFLIHRWLHDGCKPEMIADANGAHDHIAKAVEINPDAHFGREFMQLAAIDGIIAVKTGKSQSFELLKEDDKRPLEQQIEGVRGLIVLGAAWESVDIFDALARLLAMDRQASLGYLAQLRRDELLDEGKKPLVGTAEEMRKQESGSFGSMIYDSAKPDVRRDFKMLRDEAKSYESKRTAYMLVRLKAGRHPDTDPTFWSEWKEPPAPVLRDSLLKKNRNVALWGGGTAVWVVLMVWAIRRRSKKRQLESGNQP